MKKNICRNKVMVAMSGGVDSSTSAALLQKEGYEVVGATMLLPAAGTTEEDNNLPSSIRDAQKVCSILNIPHHTLDLKTEFQNTIISYLVEEYSSGRTPNPCVMCNRRMKFGLLLDKAGELGADCIATGHYVRSGLNTSTGRYELIKGADDSKDQSYFLSMLTQEQLSRTIFPLGKMNKPRVREKAKEFGLPVFEKEESQDICFISSDYREYFLAEEHNENSRGFAPGPIIDTSGNRTGRHTGLAHYTIGQRKGIGAHSEKMYVVEIRPEENTIIIGKNEELFTDTMYLSGMNWISISPPEKPIQAMVKIRYRHPGCEAEVTPLSDNSVRITFSSPQRAVTPGQTGVLYNGDIVIGGGWITRIPKDQNIS